MNLDETLAAWAAQIALPEAAADDIHRQIVATPPAGLSPRWWGQYSMQLAAGVVSSTRPLSRAA